MRSMMSEPPDGSHTLRSSAFMQLLVDVEPLEDREALVLGVVELDPLGELGRDRLDVAA